MTDRSDPDGALRPALNRFLDAVSALIDPRREILHGKTLWLDPLYTELHDSLAGQQGYTADHNPRSMPLLWAECHDELARIDQTVRQWHPEAIYSGAQRWGGEHWPPPTVQRLQALSDAKYRPQDADMLNDRAGQLEAFAKTILNLLLPEITVYLYGHACPICGQAHVRRTDVTGAAVTQPALVIKGDSALCGECRSVWDYTRLPMLGRMLGVQPTAEIGS